MVAANAPIPHPRPLNLAMGEPGEAPPPAATEAALRLIGELLHAESRPAGDARWYILPVANPDAAAGFFSTRSRYASDHLTTS